jgi:hypothetical protein
VKLAAGRKRSVKLAAGRKRSVQLAAGRKRSVQLAAGRKRLKSKTGCGLELHDISRCVVSRSLWVFTALDKRKSLEIHFCLGPMLREFANFRLY